MALTVIPGEGLWLPRYAEFVQTMILSLIDATGEKVAWIGPVWTPTGGTKSIRKVGFRFGAVVKAGGSALTVSLQDVDLTTGPPYRPDGTQDQTVAIANANTAFVTGSWIQTGNLSADRSVNFGQMLAVVLEYDGSGRLGADAVNVQNMPSMNTFHQSGVSEFTTGAWVAKQANASVLLEFSDGTFGCFLDGYPALSINQTFNSGSTPDEYALEFQVPWDCQVDAFWSYCAPQASGDVDFVLYDAASTALATVSVDYNTLSSASGTFLTRLFPSLITLSANTTYRLALRPASTATTFLYLWDVDQAGYMDVMPGGSAWRLASRTDAGAWTTTTTRRPRMGLRFVAFNPSSGSGGPVGSGRLSGGLQ